jgi:predicted O-methyltransferase YrrM
VSFKKQVIRIPVIGRIILMMVRFNMAFSYFRRPLWDLVKWVFNSRELANFTYDLEETNRQYLAALIANVNHIDHQQVLSFFREIEEDEALKQHVHSTVVASDEAFLADPNVKFGRRVGWYAFVRAAKPAIVVETGVDKGLGACVLTSAIRRNRQEGHGGYYYGTDINPKAGYLLSGELAEYGEILYGDSIESLEKMEHNIDLFINDSDHSAEYESREYETIASKLSGSAIILGDNSHVSDSLLNFSLEHGRQFLFFSEKPTDHWYPGAGIGISLNRQRADTDSGPGSN